MILIMCPLLFAYSNAVNIYTQTYICMNKGIEREKERVVVGQRDSPCKFRKLGSFDGKF